MSSLRRDFEELLTRIRHGREPGHAGFEPVYYLVFPPSRILEVKRETQAWIRRMENDGWDAVRFSVADAIRGILQEAPLRKIWLAADRKAPLEWDKTNQSLANALTGGSLQRRFETLLESLEGKAGSIVLVTDLEALHPYLRIGAIEGKLYGRFHVPTVFLYPGVRAGRSGLKFLGFYPEDGNYRSVHVGG